MHYLKVAAFEAKRADSSVRLFNLKEQWVWTGFCIPYPSSRPVTVSQLRDNSIAFIEPYLAHLNRAVCRTVK
jgi:hypothetical protein